jgi:septum formation protein
MRWPAPIVLSRDGKTTLTAIVLASASRIRRQLLASAGLSVAVVAHDVDERAVQKEAGEDPRRIARLLAEAKAKAASIKRPPSIVIGADQTLEIDGQLLTKPAGRREAKHQLGLLSGKAHQLHTAFALARNGDRITGQIRSARMTMRPLTDGDIDWYLDQVGDAAFFGVGGYQIEGLGIRLFDRIEGDYFTILGLPMIPLLAELRKLGVVSP